MNIMLFGHIEVAIFGQKISNILTKLLDFLGKRWRKYLGKRPPPQKKQKQKNKQTELVPYTYPSRN